MGCHALLQGIFPTQGRNPGLLHYRRILYNLSHQASPELGGYLAYVKQVLIEGLLLSAALGREERKWAGTFSWDN